MNVQNENLNSLTEDQLIIEKLEKEGSKISKAMKLISKRPGALNAFITYKNQILDNGPLSKKERTLISLATTVALRSCNCIPVQSKKAIDAGASEDEVIQTMLIAGLVSGSSPLGTAYSSCYESKSCSKD